MNLCEGVGTLVTPATYHSWPALTLSCHLVTVTGQGALQVTVTGVAPGAVRLSVVVGLAPTLSCGLVALSGISFVGLAVTGPTYWVPPPCVGTRGRLGGVTILSCVFSAFTLTSVTSLLTDVVHTSAVVGAGVQFADIKTASTIVPLVTVTVMTLPCGFTHRATGAGATVYTSVGGVTSLVHPSTLVGGEDGFQVVTA